MRLLLWIIMVVCLQAAASRSAISEEPPERELLQMIELLQDWEMIRNLELIKDLDSTAQVENTPARERAEVPATDMRIEDGLRWTGNLQ
ncbi:MAG: hypothetical protein GTO40_26900 [Deltaproteobacteria bacterium]|nr:hypothetical protein [Deltaproteobacteria bacterium]